jgi:DNA segregation ATPase FtsK/SpoIIIE-like protein
MARAQTEMLNNTGTPAEAAEPRRNKKAGDAPEKTKPHLRAEIVGLVLLFSGLAFGAALVTFSPRDLKILQDGRQTAETVQNAIGPVGARIADLLLDLFGLGAFMLDGLLLTLAGRTLMGKTAAPRLRPTAGIVGATLGVLILLYMSSKSVGLRPFGHDPAGFIPGAIAVVLLALLSTLGTTLVAVWMLAVSLAALTGRSLVGDIVRWVTGRAKPVAATLGQTGAQAARQGIGSLSTGLGSLSAVPSWFARRRAEKTLAEAPEDCDEPEESAANLAMQTFFGDIHAAVAAPSQGAETAVRMAPPLSPSEPAPKQERPSLPEKAEERRFESLDVPTSVRRAREEASVRIRLPETPVVVARAQTDVTPPEAQHTSHADLARIAAATMPNATRATGPMPTLDVEDLPADAFQAALPEMEDVPPPVPEAPMAVAAPGAHRLTQPDRGTRHEGGPRIVETEALRTDRPHVSAASVQGNLGLSKTWQCPPVTLVQEPPARIVNMDAAMLRENAIVLEQKLGEFNIHGEVTDIRPGPVVTTYEYRPAPGIKISKIVNLRDDLTMSLSALRVRIVAPIPGRDVVGIEVPNQHRQMVYFREIIEAPVFRESTSPLTLILGKDIEGRPICTDLARAPHMLVAGATGTGKSVGINTFLCSMLYRCSPDEVKLILIDPKILELSVYEGIPHLLLPVLDEPRKAELALKWAVAEMDRRYRLLADAEVRNLAGYKTKLPELRAAAMRKKQLAERVDANGDVSEDLVDIPDDMPYIVVVIDEFADLIMAAGKEVEIPVARLAQKARAAGIHVILATQRPSVDVITGMIKANFPTRVSFQVSSSMDSKVILGAVGAETLLGKGDMLFVPPGEGHLRRCHGTWITDEEVVAIAKHWRDQGSPKYEMDILRDPDEQSSASDMDDAEMDPLYDDAIQIVLESQQASVSFLQRKLGIGYGRSARIVDTMEARGIVGPSRGPNKPREILVHH